MSRVENFAPDALGLAAVVQVLFIVLWATKAVQWAAYWVWSPIIIMLIIIIITIISEIYRDITTP